MVCELEEAAVADELEGEEDRLMEEGVLMEEDRLMEEGVLMEEDDGGLVEEEGWMVEEELDSLVHDVLYPPSLAELL